MVFSWFQSLKAICPLPASEISSRRQGMRISLLPRDGRTVEDLQFILPRHELTKGQLAEEACKWGDKLRREVAHLQGRPPTYEESRSLGHMYPILCS